ncbi:excinuclease ABC subunit UvrC [Rhodohalobacter barkolensis]|uniref:UvrABC system protein C n=1 Tax=Rhodohalobacter barkolensis TaxID=2053187 RepID=A0A2N0VLJ2_9BACT|nr:excinuclease ABC subunit UvrC [Rhodohalobacter barkolensis]PKD45067.1 excinuclease ABC subunit C [Rhodohalobacter barkolensis]
MSISVEEKIAHLPFSPGVYQFKDSRGNYLYVGKAKKLRNRVRSYFQDSRYHDGRIKLMVSKIEDVEVIVTDSEAEALILENNLIKKHQPRYNIMYRDDKSYPYICITPGQKPRVYPTRTVVRDGSKYFGPYDHVGHMRRMLETIRKAFGLCTCAVSPKMVDKSRGAPKWHSCFDDYLQNCSGDWDDEEYQATIEKVERLLSGKTGDLIREVKEEMEIASQALEFEKAARLRDSVKSLEKYNQKMKIVANKEVHRDVFAIDVDEELGEACGVLFKIREGKLIGKFNRFLKNIEDRPRSVMMQSFVEDYYTGQMVGAIPDEVYLSDQMEEEDPLLEYLWEQRGKKVPIHVPQIGEKKHLIEMAITNARLNLGERKLEKQKAERDRIPQAVKDLKEYLKLDRLPRRIECFDNSNTQGTDPVASMVCFVDGQPRKSEYKRFKIKTVTGADDFASMKEIVRRRYSKVKKEKLQVPDLILIDGGKGQLNAALEALDEIEFRDACDVAGLAKRLEEVFLPGKFDPIMIPKTSSALKLLQRARDEAHRFAITYHRQKRSKRTLKTELTEIDGVGDKTAQKLLKEFGSVNQIKKENLETLQELLGEKLGERVHSHLQE